jgi:hypothetical protein
LEEKDACLGDPLVVDIQSFSTNNTSYGRELARIQRKDGSWTDWSGIWRDEVAAAGFKPWTNPKTSKDSNVSNVSSETQQASPSSACALAQDSGSSSTLDAGNEMMQFCHGQNRLPGIPQIDNGSFLPLSADNLISNHYNQGMLWPAHQFSQTDHFPSHGHVNTWRPNSNEAVVNFSTAVNCPGGLPDFNGFGTEFMTPMQTSQPYENALGTAADMFDFNSMPSEGISGDLCMPVDGGYAQPETNQNLPENFNTGNAAFFDSFANYGFDASTWNPPNNTQGW